MSILLVFLMYALFASVYTVAKISLESSTPLFIVGSRMFLAGALMLAFLHFMKQHKLFQFNRKQVMTIVQLGFFNIYLTNVFVFLALRQLDSYKSCFVYSLTPFITALLSYVFLSEVLSYKKWLGLIIGLVGFFPVLISECSPEDLANGSFMPSKSMGIMFLSALCSSYGWILLRKSVKDLGFTSLSANGYSMLIGGFFGICHSAIIDTWHPVPISNYQLFFACSAFLLIISNFTCYNLYGLLLKRFSATFMSFAGFTTPLITALFGWAFLSETITWHFALANVLVLLGLILFSHDELRQTRVLSEKNA